MKTPLLKVLVILSTCVTFNFLNTSRISRAEYKPNLLAQIPGHPCAFATVEPVKTTKKIELKQFGIKVEIPSNFRTMLDKNGKVEIVDPGTFKMLQCFARGGKGGGRGYGSDSFMIIANSQNITPKQAAQRELNKLTDGIPSISTQNWKNIEVTILEIKDVGVDRGLGYYKLPNINGVVQIDPGGFGYGASRENVISLLKSMRLIDSSQASN